VFGTLVAYAAAGSVGFGMQNRSQLAGSQETWMPGCRIRSLIGIRASVTSRG
jgi:hypothetical protein